MAQGARMKPTFYIPIILLVLLIPVLTHGGTELAGLGPEFFYFVMAFDIFIVNVLMRKLTPQHVTVLKRLEDEGIRIAGRFEDGDIKMGKELSVKSILKNNNAVEFVVNEDEIDSVYKITEKYFTAQSLKIIPEITLDIDELNPEELARKYANNLHTLKIHDSEKSILVRIAEKPSHIKIIWLCLGLVLLANFLIRIYFG